MEAVIDTITSNILTCQQINATLKRLYGKIPPELMEKAFEKILMNEKLKVLNQDTRFSEFLIKMRTDPDGFGSFFEVKFFQYRK